MSITDWLVISGLLVICILAGYAAWLWYRIWRNRQQQAKLQQERNTRLAGDLRILAQGLLEGQLPPIEGAIRIKVLLDNYSGPRPSDLDASVFETLYDATAHIPTHQAWKDLPPAQRQQHERQMEELEQQYHDALHRAARSLKSGLQ